MTNKKHTHRDTGGQIQSIDDQLRQMFQIHASLFDEQERKAKRIAQKYDKLATPKTMAALLPDTPYFDCGEVK